MKRSGKKAVSYAERCGRSESSESDYEEKFAASGILRRRGRCSEVILARVVENTIITRSTSKPRRRSPDARLSEAGSMKTGTFRKVNYGSSSSASKSSLVRRAIWKIPNSAPTVSPGETDKLLNSRLIEASAVEYHRFADPVDGDLRGALPTGDLQANNTNGIAPAAANWIASLTP